MMIKRKRDSCGNSPVQIQGSTTSFMNQLMVSWRKSFGITESISLNILKYCSLEQCASQGALLHHIEHLANYTLPANIDMLNDGEYMLDLTKSIRPKWASGAKGCERFWFADLHPTIFRWFLSGKYHDAFKRDLVLQDAYSAELMLYLAYFGRHDLLKVLYEYCPEFFCGESLFVSYASEMGHLEVIQFLSSIPTIHFVRNDMDWASKNGHLDIIKFLHSNRSEGCNSIAMDQAARNGHFEIVKFLDQNRSEGCSSEAMDAAARNGHFDIVKYLHYSRNEGCTTNAMDGAAKYGHFEIVKFLDQNRTEGCTTVAMDAAAREGNLELVMYLHENRTEGCTTKAIDYAVRCSHFEVVKFLCENRNEGFTKDAVIDLNRRAVQDYENFENAMLPIAIGQYLSTKSHLFRK